MPVDLVENIGDYSSFIRAPDRRAADRLARNRGIGEKVICEWAPEGRKAPYLKPSELMAKRALTARQRLELIHGVTWLSYILMQSMKTPPSIVLGDEGIVHQVIHCMISGRPLRSSLVATLQHFEQLAPGYA